MLLYLWAGLSRREELALTASQGVHWSSNPRCCQSVLTIRRTGIQEGSSPLAAADGCSREEACSACTAATRISVGSVALLAPSTDARKASSAAAPARLLWAAAAAAASLAPWPCKRIVRAEIAAPTPLRAFALTCGTKRGQSSQGSLFCPAAKAILLLLQAAGMQHQPTSHALLTLLLCSLADF